MFASWDRIDSDTLSTSLRFSSTVNSRLLVPQMRSPSAGMQSFGGGVDCGGGSGVGSPSTGGGVSVGSAGTPGVASAHSVKLTV
jgi:hypothetical protein